MLEQIEALRKEIRRLEESNHVTALDLAVLKTKIAFIAIIATLVGSPLVSWVLRKVGI